MAGKTPTISRQIIDGISDGATQLAEVKLTLQVVSTNISQVAEVVSEIQRTLRGSNGDTGLVGRIEILEQDRKDCDVDRIGKIIDGDAEKPGLLERMRKAERFMESIQRWAYVIFSAVLIDFVLRLWPELVNLVKGP